MTPVFQAQYDDCFRACLASLANCDLEDIPHFFAGLSNGEPVPAHRRMAIDNWFTRLGLALIRFPLPAESEPQALWMMQESNPGPHYILTGRNTKGQDHAVVAYGDQVVHDPAGTRHGVLVPHASEMYGVCMIGLLL